MESMIRKYIMFLDDMKKPIDQNGIIKIVAVLLVYIILTLILTYPLILNITTHFGGIAEDVYWHAWNIWWIKYSIIDLKTNPIFTEYIFYPNGVSLAFSTMGYIYSLIFIPIQVLFGVITAYNFVVLHTFILSAFGTFLLVYYLTKNKTAAFISGFIFAFSPNHIIRTLIHLNLANVQWIPFYVLFLIKLNRENRKRNIILASIFLLFTALSSWQYLFFLIFLTFIYLLCEIFWVKETKLDKTFLKKFGVFTILSILLISPFAYPTLREYSISPLKTGLDLSIVHSADLISYFIPSPYNTFRGKYFEHFYQSFKGPIYDSITYIGYSVLLLALYSIFKFKKEAKFWMLSAVFFFILSLGPILKILGTTEFFDSKITIPLPYALFFNYLPFFSAFRTPGRFAIMVIFCLSILAGYGIKSILNGMKRRDSRYVFTLMILSIIIFEFINIPFPLSKREIPNFYRQIAEDKEDYALFEVPSYIAGEFMFYQTLHKKKLVYGRVSQMTPSSGGKIADFITKPLIKELTYLEINATEMDENYIKSGVDILRESRIKYIIVNKEFLQKEMIDSLNELLGKALGEPIHEDEYTISYRVF